MSDLHLEFRNHGTPKIPPEHFHLWGDVCLPKSIDADVVVIAGDHHPHEQVREYTLKAMEQAWGVPVIFTPGNHDYYHGTFPTSCGTTVDHQGVRFALSTLWTHLTPMDEINKMEMNDFRCIKGITVAKWNEMNRASVEFLAESNADVIVTHHAPSFQSISPQWQGHFLNPFFANNLDFSLFPITKLFLHGHVHNEFDYIQGDIRVVCNPWGYPHERAGSEKIKFVEL